MKYLLPVLLLLAIPAWAETDVPPPSSLFYTSDEAGFIDASMDKRPASASIAGIHLGAVMFYSAEDWTLWLQNQRWTPDTDKPDLHVMAVQPNEVTLSWTSSPGAKAKEITLRPYQTYEIATGKIVEGAP
ncbi:MAG TPA: hypothetical protein VFR09_04635 [Alphaproteobacteria bacterium]|nr:hypothetical protein [Alphaproteobacteria bacterium]